MLDVGWSELVLVIVIAILVIGPKELPALMVGLGRIVRRIQYVRYAFTQQFEDLMREADIKDIRNSVNFEAKNFNEAEADEDYIAELPEPQPLAGEQKDEP